MSETNIFQFILSKGEKRNWWKNETLKKYWERATCVENQYDDFYIKRINATINGTKTLGENIADHGGIEAAYRAYGKYTNLLIHLGQLTN